MHDDEDARFHALSEGQHEILSVAAENPTSKFISQRTRFSPTTIDKYLSESAKILGVPDRRRAIHAYQEWKLRQSINSINSRTPPEAGSPAIAQTENLTIIGSIDAGAKSRFSARVIQILITIWRKFGVPPIGGRINDLTISDRLLAACKAAFIGTILMIAVAMFLKEGFKALS